LDELPESYNATRIALKDLACQSANASTVTCCLERVAAVDTTHECNTEEFDEKFADEKTCKRSQETAIDLSIGSVFEG
jgi:hypothetical protein